jgi:peptide/nickel transport system substrate-binding protein
MVDKDSSTSEANTAALPARRLVLKMAAGAALAAGGRKMLLGEAQAQKAKLKTLVIASPSTPAGLDRDKDLTQISQRVVKNVYEQLYEYPLVKLPNGLMGVDPNGFGSRFNSMLAASAPQISTDGRVYTINLRKGVKSRYGNELTTDDIRYSWQRSFGIKVCGGGFVLPLSGCTGMDNLEIIDKYTYRISLKEDNYLLSRTLENECGPPVLDSTEVRKHDNSDDPLAKQWVSLHDAGFGPYQVESWTPGQEITLRGRDDYWGGKPKIDRVVFKEIPSSADRLALLIAGQVDIADELLPREVATAAAQKGVKVDFWPMATGFDALIHNAKIAPHGDRRVREALNLAIPHDQIIEKIYFGRATRWDGVIPPAHEGSISIPRKTDLEKAKSLIEEAGAKGTTLELYYGTGSPVHEEISVALQTAYSKVGINLELKKLPDSVFVERLYKKELPLAIYRDAAFQPDAGYALGLWYPSRSFFAFGQMAMSTSDADKANQAKIDELIVKGTKTINDADRNQVWKDLQLLIDQTQIFGYLPLPGMTVVRRDNIIGAACYNDNFYRVYDMDKLTT